jgi:transposase
MVALNIVGVDPHRKNFTACVLDERGGSLGHEHFANTSDGYRAAIEWATSLGPVERWGVENASSLGRHLAQCLVGLGFDVRDVPPHRSAQQGRGRHQGKSDLLDAHRIAQETQNHPRLACAFKHRQPSAPDPIREQIALWHNARRSLTRVRVQLLGEIDAMIHDLPKDLRLPVSAMKTVRARIHSLDRLSAALDAVEDPVVRLRIELIRQRVAMLNDVLEQDRIAGTELDHLVRETKSQLCKLVGIAPRSAAEILVEVGDIRRFSEAGFARYTGTAPIPATSGEGGGELVRHRLSRGGNRKLNATIHRMAMIQLRFEPRARTLFDHARDNGHTRRESMRILKRHLAAVIYRTMLRDAISTSRLT